MGNTDTLYDWATGTNIDAAKLKFQQCIASQDALAAFGSGNPDLGGIGVILSLSILCITCTISTLAVLILGMIQSDHKRNTRFESTPDPKTPYQKIIFRMNESFMSSLRNFLDSALYLSLTVQIATLVWTQRFDPAAYAGKIGDFIYDLVLLIHFRLLLATASTGYALYFNLAATGTYKEFAPQIYNQGEKFGCLNFIKNMRVAARAKKNGGVPPPKTPKTCPPPHSPPKRIALRVVWGLYFFVWAWNQFLPLYLLWRIRWMRRNIRSAIHDYLQQVKLTAPGSYANVAAVETWDNDEWTFGQVLSMSLWFPALLEMFYSMIGCYCAGRE
ncbi:hypothetical protein FPQ18DRAFT_307414 [Pyronema domesticum]|nr:hypothetical protein FPQ18DRAFT_307414 [Pyronema domesticum]